MATYKIAIDTLGSDKGPETIVQGALMALAENPELSVALFGDEQVIRAYLATVEHDADRIEIVHAPDAITNYDNPMEAIFKKPESSLVKALQALAQTCACGHSARSKGRLYLPCGYRCQYRLYRSYAGGLCAHGLGSDAAVLRH